MNAARPGRPLLGAAAAIAAGAAWGTSGEAGASSGAAAALLAASAAAFLALRAAPRRFRALRAAAAFSRVALFAAAFAASGLNAAHRAAARMETVELFREALDSREAAFRGRVAAEPSVAALKHGGARMSFDLVPAEIVFETDSVPVPDRGLRIRVEWYGPRSMDSERPPFPVPAEGEGWTVAGTLREIPVRGPVPLVALALRSGEGCAMRAPELDAGKARKILRDVRRAASRALGRGLPRDDAGLAIVRAMVLGERAEVPEAVTEAFRTSGTIHVFAISGLHVAMVATALAFVLKRARAPAAASVAALTAALSFYVALTGARPSAMRALAMSLLAFGAPLAGRRSDPALSLAGALAVLLALDPLRVRDAGFEFSFLCTAAMLGLARPFADAADSALARTAAVRRLAETRVGRSRFVRRAARYFAEIPPVSLAAWLASAPLTAAVFGRVSPVSVLCNAAVLPLAGATIFAALAALAEAAVFPAAVCAALPLQRAAALCASLMAKAAGAAAAVPGGTFETAPWPPAAVAAWFAALAALCAWANRRTGDREPPAWW